MSAPPVAARAPSLTARFARWKLALVFGFAHYVGWARRMLRNCGRNTMHVNGQCHCGAITYEAELDPDQVALCHCTDCQMLTGSAFRASVPVRRTDFTLLAGQPKHYVKTAESGAKRVQAFCADCGTPVYSSALVDPPTLSLRTGCLQQRALLPPKRQIWRCFAQAWVTTSSRCHHWIANDASLEVLLV